LDGLEVLLINENSKFKSKKSKLDDEIQAASLLNSEQSVQVSDTTEVT